MIPSSYMYNNGLIVINLLVIGALPDDLSTSEHFHHFSHLWPCSRKHAMHLTFMKDFHDTYDDHMMGCLRISLLNTIPFTDVRHNLLLFHVKIPCT